MLGTDHIALMLFVWFRHRKQKLYTFVLDGRLTLLGLLSMLHCYFISISILPITIVIICSDSDTNSNIASHRMIVFMSLNFSTQTDVSTYIKCTGQMDRKVAKVEKRKRQMIRMRDSVVCFFLSIICLDLSNDIEWTKTWRDHFR